MLPLEKLTHRHEVLMYVCALLSFLAVALGGLSPLMSGFFLLCWGGSWFAQRRGWTAKIPTTFWNIVILATVALTGAQMYLTDEAIIDIGVRFILLLMIIKLLSRQGAERDDWQVYALTFLLMAAGTAINEDITYGIIFALYVFLGTFGLALFHLRTETASQPRRLRREQMSRIYQVTLVVLAGAVFASSVAIFFVFPRVGLGFFASKSREGMAMTGFSDQVELGSHGLIRDNPAVALRVEFDDETMPPDAKTWHWRMMAFDTYDGVQWRREARPRNDNLPYDSDGRVFDLTPMYSEAVNAAVEDKKTRTIRVYMEPMGVTQAPVIWPARSFALPNSLPVPFNPKAAWIRADKHYDDVYIQQRNELGTIFEMNIVEGPAQDPMREKTFDKETLERLKPYMQLPEGLDRLRALSAQVTEEATTPHEKARAISEHLQNNYAYTTDLPPVDSENPIESFLFDTKTGHCEFYASSMALMMRAQGVPTRLVNGFLGGVWNSSGAYMAVRQGDAHSWVEVYIPEYGWVPFDPTPSSGTQPLEQQGLQARLRDVYDAARMNWMRWVIEYDLDTQLSGLRAIGEALSPSASSSSGDGADRQASDDAQERGLNLREIILWTVYLIICGGAWRTARRLKRRAPPWLARLPVPDTLTALGGASVWVVLGSVWVGWFYSFAEVPTSLGVIGPLAAALVGVGIQVSFGGSSEEIAHGLFEDLERIAAARGYIRGMDEGPAQFIERLASACPDAAEDLRFFASRYLGVRFGERALTPETARRLKDALKRIRAAMRASQR